MLERKIGSEMATSEGGINNHTHTRKNAKREIILICQKKEDARLVGFVILLRIEKLDKLIFKCYLKDIIVNTLDLSYICQPVLLFW